MIERVEDFEKLQCKIECEGFMRVLIVATHQKYHCSDDKMNSGGPITSVHDNIHIEVKLADSKLPYFSGNYTPFDEELELMEQHENEWPALLRFYMVKMFDIARDIALHTSDFATIERA
jgi:hypothetical protein